MDNKMAKEARNLNHKNVTGDKNDNSNMAQHENDKMKEILEKAISVQD